MIDHPILSMQGISKTFPGVRALENVHFELRAGEVHGLLGENGAGKSTLIKILTGVYTPDQGKIVLAGQHVTITHPSQAEAFGISAVHQELSLEPYLSAAENIFLGRQPINRLGLIDHGRMNREATELLDRLGMNVPPKRAAAELSVAHRQMVSVAHAVSTQARIVVMDEPTAPLTEHETEKLFEIVRRLREQGIAVIYITHRLEEIFEIADRVTVLRDGQYISTMNVGDTSLEKIISLMIGRSMTDLFVKKTVAIGEPILEVHKLTRRGMVADISITLRRGEILGIFGLAGAGRTELARMIFGAESFDSGEILLDGEKIHPKHPRRAIDYGIGLVPEDRRNHGLVLEQSVKANISLPTLGRLASMGIISRSEEIRLAQRQVSHLQIRTPSIYQPVKLLSGGNQQRVVIGKWLGTEPKVLILDEPTKGVDIGAKASIHALMCDLAGQGVGILLISSELPEVLSMSDRILVMHRGHISASFSRSDATADKLMAAATGERFDA